jgi:DNA-binding CsgD family transcriptional regulator
MARVDLRGVAERLATAGDITAIGSVVGDSCEAGLPFGSFGWAVIEPRVTEKPCMVLRSQEFPTDWLAGRFLAILPAIERDLGGLMKAISEPHAYDGFAKFPVETIKDTELLNDHWWPIHCHHQIVAPLWHGGRPAGYFAVIRSRKEPRFMADDLRFIEELRVLAERAIGGVAAMGVDGVSRTLDALAQAFPYPAFLFEPDGRLRWMSDEGAVRLGVDSARLGAGRLIGHCAVLEALCRHAAALGNDPSADAEAGMRIEGLLRDSERLAVRRFGENGSALLLLAITPAMAGLPGEAMRLSTASLPRLGAVESKVARLAAEGYTVLNIATRLGITEATVRTHMHRVYVKLGVHGRAELTCTLLRGRC